MAEIEIQKKKNNNIWPWIIGLIVVAALIWLLAGAFDDDDDVVEQEPVSTTAAISDAEPISSDDMPDDVEEYITFANQDDQSEMGVEHEYTSQGITKLALALDALVEEKGIQDVNVDEKRRMMQSKADYIQQNWESTKHADSLKSAFSAANELMASIQEANYPDMGPQVGELETAAEAIDPQDLTLEQKNIIKNYFDKSSQILQAMAGN